MTDGYLNLDDTGAFEAATSLLSTALEKLYDEPAWVFWAVFGAHSAAQSAMVLHLSGSMQLGALHDDDVSFAKEYLEAPHECSAHFSWREPRLAPFSDLLDRLKRNNCWDRPGGPITLSSTTIALLRSLNKDRNQVIHFTPVRWSYPRVRLAERVAASLELIDAIDDEPARWAFRSLRRQESSVQELTDSVRAWLNAEGD